MHDKIEKLKHDLSDQKLSNAKLTTQLDYSVESSKVYDKNIVAYKQEICALRTKSEQYSNLSTKVNNLFQIFNSRSFI